MIPIVKPPPGAYSSTSPFQTPLDGAEERRDRHHDPVHVPADDPPGDSRPCQGGSIETYRAGPQKILITGYPMVHGFGGNGKGGCVYDAVVIATIPIAALCARFTARRRTV